jgi:hypothetical protein
MHDNLLFLVLSSSYKLTRLTIPLGFLPALLLLSINNTLKSTRQEVSDGFR